MKPRAGLTWGLVSAVGAVVIAAVVWLGFQEPHGQKQRLPDGTVIELVGVTYGTEHVFVYGNAWERLWDAVRDHLPDDPSTLPAWFPGPVGKLMTGAARRRPFLLMGSESPGWLDGNRAHFTCWTPQPVLWFRVHLRKPVDAGGELPRDLFPMAADRHGCTYGPGVLYYTDPTLCWIGELPWRGGDILEAVALDTYPREEARFRLALCDRRSGNRLAQFVAANPAPISAKTFRAAPYPLRANAGDLSVTLLGMRRAPLEERHFAQVVARAECREAHLRPGGWRPYRLVVSDAEANSREIDQGELAFPSDLERLKFVPGLCFQDPAWKLRLDLVRSFPTPRSDFVWTARGVPAPRHNRWIPSRAKFRHGDILVSVDSVTGDGAWSAPGGTSGSSTEPDVQVTASSRSGIQLKLLRATDERGRPVSLDNAFTEEVIAAGTRDGEFSAPGLSRARRLDLTFAINRVRTVTFFARPPSATP